MKNYASDGKHCILCHISMISHCRFNVVSGKYPFEGDNIYRLYETIGKGQFTIPEEAGPLLGSLLEGKV